ncbi:MAG: agmatinase [Clostridia bacterium]|nr:agmatinase [Clostridia bacterium]
MSINIEGFIKSKGFLASVDNYKDAGTVLAGIPFDATTSFRPGARWGPQAIRNVSEVLEEYSPYLKRDLAKVPFYDAGDLDLLPGRVEENLKLMEKAADVILKDNKKPIFLGGEHLVSYPLIRAVYRHYPDLLVLHFDAHADLREDYLGEKLSHATVMRLVAEAIGPGNIYQFGIRSGTWGEFAYGQEETNFFMDEILSPLEKLVPYLSNFPLYISLDIDVLDPAYAPGTGTPESGGCTPQEIFKVIQLLKDANVVAFDLVEVCPAYDQSDLTAVLAAKIVREAILAWG